VEQAENPQLVFDARSYGAAQKAAAEGKKWFLVVATAEWCSPCRRMEKTTWRDGKVAAWVAANAIAVQIDVDKERSLAKELKIDAMPTVIAVKEGNQEYDRIVGYRNPSDFLAWTEGIARGEKAIDAVRKRAGERTGGTEKVNIKARLDLANSLWQSGKADEAAEEYAWLWRHMLEYDRAFVGVRSSFMASNMERLAVRNEGAKKKFMDLRDEAEKAMAEEKVSVDDLADWMVLNKIVSDSQRTLKWFDEVKDDTHWKPMLERITYRLEDLLIQNKRWADLGKLYSDPMELLGRAQEMRHVMSKQPLPQGIDEEMRKTMGEMPLRTFRNSAGRLYAALLAAGNEKDARRIAERARELDDSPRMVAALASTALSAGQVRKEQVEWLTEAIKSDASLKDLQERALEALAPQDPK
jgi:thiol-disulfide isomerase/thioredoxin